MKRIVFQCRKCYHNLVYDIPDDESVDGMLKTFKRVLRKSCPNCGEEPYENWVLFKVMVRKDKKPTVRVYGHSDDQIIIEGSKLWSTNGIQCFDRDVVIQFDDDTTLRMSYDDGAWQANFERLGAANPKVTKLVENDDYYSDLVEIAAEIVNVRTETKK